MALYIKNDEIVNTLKGIEHDGFITYNPTSEQMEEWGYELYEPEASVPTKEDEIIQRIEDLKQMLANTDYIAIKSIEGYDCDLLYPGWRKQRADLRDEINDLEEQLLP